MTAFYYKPRVDEEILRQYSKGIICLSACLAGALPRLILAGRHEDAVGFIERYKDIFGEDNFFFRDTGSWDPGGTYCDHGNAVFKPGDRYKDRCDK